MDPIDSPLPDDFVPQWMTRLCICGHVDSAHSGPCTGRLVATSSHEPEECPCTRFSRQTVSARSDVIRSGPWDIKRSARNAA